MKKVGFLLAALICLLISNLPTQAQTLLADDFDYPSGDNLTDHGWVQFSGGTSLTVANSGLSYTNYLSGGTGNAASLSGSGEWVARTFTPISSNNLYVSFLINASDATTTTSNFPEVVVLTPTASSARLCLVLYSKKCNNK